MTNSLPATRQKRELSVKKKIKESLQPVTMTMMSLPRAIVPRRPYRW